MIVQSYLIDKEYTRITLYTDTGELVIWGWAKDDLVHHNTGKGDESTIEDIKKELKIRGYFGANKPIGNSILVNVKRYLETL